MTIHSRLRAFLRGLVPVLCLVGLTTQAQAQATFRGRVLSDRGEPLVGSSVVLGELKLQVVTNSQGQFVLTVPAARVNGQQVTLSARAIGYKSVARIIAALTEGERTIEFSLVQDVNKLEEIIVTGVIEGIERAKVPFAVGRVTAEELPVGARDPLTALQGKVPGVRVAQTSGQPGTTPEILLRGPTSINGASRGQGPLIIVDGAIMNVGSLEEIGGLDIASVEVVKGAAAASLYGTRAANGVITVTTKRGLTGGQDGVRFNIRSEYGIADASSDYGQPINHHLQLDETGTMFCANVSGAARCAQRFNWMEEILRINNVVADTTRTPLNTIFNSGGNSTDLRNIYQVNIWPGQYYNTAASFLTRNPTVLTAIDATGKVGNVGFFVSGAYSDEAGAVRFLNGIQSRRARVNLDYSARSDLKVSISTLYDRSTTDNRGFGFGVALRGAPAGTNYLARDTLGRLLVRGGGSGLRGTNNGANGLNYNGENFADNRTSNRFLGSMTASYFPADWVTFEGTVAYDNRDRTDIQVTPKGYRTRTVSTANNNGNIDLDSRNENSTNASLTATFRRQLKDNLNAKLSFRGLWDQSSIEQHGSAGQIFRVANINQSSATSTNFSTRSNSQETTNLGFFAGATLDYKDRYILEGSFRYDGSSRFGAGNRWAPFGRVSGVWRVSEEPWYNLGFLNEFRLRGSRGTAGTTPNFVAQYEVYNVTSTGITLDQAGNSTLRPETTTEIEVGADMELFNRIGLDLTYAHGTTRDQILQVGVPAALGFTTQWQNAGTLVNETVEIGVTVPVVNSNKVFWQMRGSWDRTRTTIAELFVPEFVYNGGTNQGTSAFFQIREGERFGTIYGAKFAKSCSDLPTAFQSDCGDGKSYQVNNKGWLTWVGAGNSWRDGITKNLWTTHLPASSAPFNRQVGWGNPIMIANPDAPNTAQQFALGNVLPDFRFTFTNDIQYKRLTLYTLLDGTIGHKINNQGEGWGLLDFTSANFDQGAESVETAKPVGYSWRCGPPCNAGGVGGFYDALGANNYNVEDGSYAKLREVSLTYKLGQFVGLGDWTVGLVGRNLLTITKYSGFDPEIGATGGGNSTGSGLINQVDAFGFPTLRTFTFSISSRF